MEIRTSTFKIGNKRKKGSPKKRLHGCWRVKIKYKDEAGRWVVGLQKTYKTRDKAIDARPVLEDEFKKTRGQIVEGSKMTFTDLAEWSKRNIYQKAVIVQGEKVAGVKSSESVHIYIDALKLFFGAKRIGQITKEDLANYIIWRDKLGSRNPFAKSKRPVGRSTINRELAAMRRMMKKAYDKGWITSDVFKDAKVISKNAEKPRKRLLSKSEEDLLLACCFGEHTVTYKRKGKEVSKVINCGTSYLKAIVLLALDSALRKGEILKLKWQDIDLENNQIRIVGTNTKTEKERLVLLTERTKNELLQLSNFSYEGTVFSTGDFKRSWATAKRLSGISNLHFHDLRRAAITRMILSGTPAAIVADMAGHASLTITHRHYITTDTKIVYDAGTKMNAYIAEGSTTPESELIN